MQQFKSPGKAERLQAIGSTQGLPETLRRAFDPGSDFEPMSTPNPGEWLAVHSETGQTFDDFVRTNWNRPNHARSRLYLQPLGEFRKEQSPSVERLRQFAAVYFGMEVKTLPALAFTEMNLTIRFNPYTRNRQILTGDVLAILQKKIPKDAFCVLAITMQDLYPDPSWNFVFGQASLDERVGVYSFARYDPAFYGERRGNNYQKILLKRSCKVLVHEMAHMFGLQHCIFFKCVLNGSNHLEESDARPLHLCLVCLRKLHFSIGFDVVERYRKLLNFYQVAGFDTEASWLSNRLKEIIGNKAGLPR